MICLRIPDHIPNNLIGAGIAYANAGWYMLPVKRAVKHAGSVLGKGWPAKSSRDPQQITDWFAAEDYGLAIHVGRSGAIAFDVDHPDLVPDDLAAALENPAVPYQSTRDPMTGRGHYPFLLPPGRIFGNRNGTLGKAWGEVRGTNGIIIVEPSIHEKADQGGRYQWFWPGPLVTLPENIAAQLPDTTGEAEGATASDAEVKRWIAEHQDGTEPEGAAAILSKYRAESATASRYTALRDSLLWACKEINDGKLPANILGELRELHTQRLRDTHHPNGAAPHRIPRDYRGILSWAVGTAKTSTYTDHRIRDAYTMPDDGHHNGQAPHTAWDVPDLLTKQFPAEKWVVMKLIPAGLTVLSGPPKQGKSFMALRLCTATATGQPFLARNTTQGRVLYLALEDGARRVQKRLRMMPEHTGIAPGVMEIRTAASTLDDGLITELEQWRTRDNPNSPRLIVIDVFQRIRPVGAGKDKYAEDYAGAAGLQKWANLHGVAVVILHHNRKPTQGDDGDPFMAVSGSTGLTGAVDQVMVLRGSRGAPEAAMFISGRDVEQQEVSLILTNGLWEFGAMPIELVTLPNRCRWDRDVWRWLHEVGQQPTQALADHFKLSADAVLKRLRRVEEAGWITSDGKGSKGNPVFWEAATDPTTL